ncbi:hypothetical protein HGRIS_001660 [Hohenbuehelia grisea]|uniref:Uncharacterized protein n=1 Tax=Hohenbuehelia grisea TaxID=104357 RepID=A0ABR3JI26_9AGAR
MADVVPTPARPQVRATALLSPQAKNDPDPVHTTDEGTVEFCESDDFKTCFLVEGAADGRCLSIPLDRSDVFSSIRLGKNTTCTIWEFNDCAGSALRITSNIPSLQPFDFDNDIQSFTCSIGPPALPAQTNLTAAAAGSPITQRGSVTASTPAPSSSSSQSSILMISIGFTTASSTSFQSIASSLPTTLEPPRKANSSSPKSSRVSVIVGVTCGVLVGSLLTGLVIFIICRNRRRRRFSSPETDVHPFVAPSVSIAAWLASPQSHSSRGEKENRSDTSLGRQDHWMQDILRELRQLRWRRGMAEGRLERNSTGRAGGNVTQEMAAMRNRIADLEALVETSQNHRSNSPPPSYA